MLSTAAARKLAIALSLASAISVFAPAIALSEAAPSDGPRIGNWVGAPPAKKDVQNRFVDDGSRIKIIERAGDQDSCQNTLFVPAHPRRCQNELHSVEAASIENDDLEARSPIQKIVAPNLTTGTTNSQASTGKNAPPSESHARPDVEVPESVKPKPIVVLQPVEPKVSKTDRPQSPSILSCDKGAAIVSDYGFTGVRHSDCDGQVYSFNASRDGKPFMITLNSVSGELIKVSKLALVTPQ